MLDVDATLQTARDNPQPMPVAAQPPQEELIALLDPDRDYGDRTFEDVLAGIRSGKIVIQQGNRLPMLFQTDPWRSIKGTGQPTQDGVSAQQRALHHVRQLGLDDIDWAYLKLRDGMSRGDPRYDKIYWELVVGKPSEAKGGEAMAEAFKALIAAMEKPDVRTVTLDG